jgi:hypothetical protein
MMTSLSGIYAFVAEYWVAEIIAATVVGGWLFICHELCATAEPEREMDDAGGGKSARPRHVLSSQRQIHAVHPHASLSNRRSWPPA